MIFETMTHKEILDQLLGNLVATEDKTPNSFSYDNLSSMAILAEDFIRLIYELSLKFDIENLEGEELEKRVYEITGLKRKEATKAYGYVEIKGAEGTKIPKDTIFLGNGVEYTIAKDYVIPQGGTLKVLVTCRDTGPVGNVSAGVINEVQPKIHAIDTIQNPQEIENGYIRETDSLLLERYYEKLENPPKAGNPAHYKYWAEEVDGIGNAKVFRTWKGPSTVRVVVVSMDRTGVDEEMLKKVKGHIMEEAPIHWENLTVDSAEEVKINLSFKLKLQEGYTLEAVEENIRFNIEQYLYRVSFRQSFVSYAKLGGAILESAGVKDYEDLKVNSIMDNIGLKDVEVGVLGNLEVEVV